MTSYTPQRQALAEAFLGDTMLAKALFASPQTFDQRILSLLQGLGQLDEVLLANAISGNDLAGLLREIAPTDQAARIAWIQSVKSFMLNDYHSEYGTFVSAGSLTHRLYKLASINPTTLTSLDIVSGLPSIFLFSNAFVQEFSGGKHYKFSGALNFYPKSEISNDTGYREHQIFGDFTVNYAAGGPFSRFVDLLVAGYPFANPPCRFRTFNDEADPLSSGPIYDGYFRVLANDADSAWLSFQGIAQVPFYLAAAGFNPRLHTHPNIQFSLEMGIAA